MKWIREKRDYLASARSWWGRKTIFYARAYDRVIFGIDTMTSAKADGLLKGEFE